MILTFCVRIMWSVLCSLVYKKKSLKRRWTFFAPPRQLTVQKLQHSEWHTLTDNQEAAASDDGEKSKWTNIRHNLKRLWVKATTKMLQVCLKVIICAFRSTLRSCVRLSIAIMSQLQVCWFHKSMYNCIFCVGTVENCTIYEMFMAQE